MATKRGSGNGTLQGRGPGVWPNRGKQAPTMQQRAEHVRDQAKRYSLDAVVKRLTKPTSR